MNSKIPKKMKAAVLYKTGEPLVVEEIDIPELKEGQVLVKVAYSGVCRSQLMEVKGFRGEDKYLPHLLGHEGSGKILAVGEGVQKVVPEDTVVMTWIKGDGMNVAGPKYRKGDQEINAGGITTFNEYAILSENRVVKIPDSFPMDLAWLFGCAIPTGAGIVLNSIQPESKDSIAFFGLGGVGMSALFAAACIKCENMVAIDIDPKKLELAKQLGAKHLINPLKEDALAKIMEITEGRGVDYSVEASGSSKIIEEAFKSVRNQGGLCVFASHPPAEERISLDPFDLICGKCIKGSWGGDFYPDRDLLKFFELFQSGQSLMEKFKSVPYKLEDINQALDDLDQGRVVRAYIEF